MYINASMTAALQTKLTQGVQVALLVIDEEDNAAAGEVSTTPGSAVPASNVTACQQRLLMYMQRMQVPIWSIRFLQYYPAAYDGPDNTRVPLRALYNGTERLLRKPHPNAFRETTLHQDLQALNVTCIVIMGWHTEACVHATVGSRWWDPGMDDGATHLGYTVMTCNQVLHGGAATWSNADPAHYAQLEFYANF